MNFNLFLLDLMALFGYKSGVMDNKASVPAVWARFLLVWACFSVFTSFTNTFISTYLIRATGSDGAVMIFNMILGGVQPFAMVAAVWTTRRLSALISQRVGLCLYAAAFLFLCVMSEGAAPYSGAVGIALSVANGFFYVPFALQLLSYTRDDNRDRCYGLQNAISGAAAVAVPALSGALISAFGSFEGYRVLFAAGLCLSALSVALSFRLSPVVLSSGSPELKKVTVRMIRSVPVRASLWATVATGFFNGTLDFFLNALIYSRSGDERLVGFAASASGAAYVAASLLYSRFATVKRRRIFAAAAITAAILAAVPMLFTKGAAAIFAFQIIMKAASAFFITPPLNDYFGAVGRDPFLKDFGGEAHTVHEFPYALGRVAGILMTMAFMRNAGGEAPAVIIILLIQIIPVLLMKRMERE